MSVNKVILVGNVGREPEVRSMGNGNEVASFSIATSDSWRDKQTGEKREKTEWHNIVVYSQGLVNVIKNYIHKGSKLYIEGSLQTRKWADNSGVERRTTEVIIQGYNGTIQMLDGRSSSNAGGNYSNTSSNYSNNSNQSSNNAGGFNAGNFGGQSNTSDSNMNSNAGVNPSLEEELDDEIPF